MLTGALLCSLVNYENSTRRKLRYKNLEYPADWPAPVYDFKSNPLSEEGIELGRQLFYDGLLSKDGNFPCASCHQQGAAFGTFDHDLSHGFNDQHSLRNAPPLQNLAWQPLFHADGGINHLDVQPLAPITAPNEMAETIDNVLAKLQATKHYPPLFKQVFGSAQITTQNMSKALSQFLLTMVSANSKYDRVMAGKDTFSLPQQLGHQMFMEKCAGCHPPPFFTDFSFRNIGLPVEPTLNDFGRMTITNDPRDSLKFKVPSLRNIAASYPYGHDGRIFDLQSMLDHYRNEVQQSPTTDSLLQKGIPLSNFQKGQIIAFLYTLTDSSFLKNKKLGAPGLP